MSGRPGKVAGDRPGPIRHPGLVSMLDIVIQDHQFTCPLGSGRDMRRVAETGVTVQIDNFYLVPSLIRALQLIIALSYPAVIKEDRTVEEASDGGIRLKSDAFPVTCFRTSHTDHDRGDGITVAERDLDRLVIDITTLIQSK